jgi:hypothetical protein
VYQQLASAQTRARGAKSSTFKFDSKPLNLDVDELPANYIGNSYVDILIAVIKRQKVAVKGEFDVLGTFTSDDKAGANARLEQVKSKGFRDAYIVDTNSYSNFTPNRLAVVLGPYSESEARRIGSQVRTLTPTIKPGW